MALSNSRGLLALSLSRFVLVVVGAIVGMVLVASSFVCSSFFLATRIFFLLISRFRLVSNLVFVASVFSLSLTS